jgi:ferredoxin
MKKITINIIDLDGIKHKLQVNLDSSDYSLMEAVRDFGLSIGHCGGMALCASCHCYIINGPLLSEKSEEEKNMLNQLYNDKHTSRLICQIPLQSHLDGITLQLANN